MFCRECGYELADDAVTCSKCGVATQQSVQKIPNHLIGSILTTICCCPVFGIVAIVYAAQVNTKLVAGDIQGAIASSKKAKAWMWWGVGIGFVVQLLLRLAFLGAQFAPSAQ